MIRDLPIHAESQRVDGSRHATGTRSQRDFATLASVLRQAGYRNEFVYGDESHFDSMRSFFLGNGFHSIGDQKDFAAPTFVGSWAVSDEDLFWLRPTSEFESCITAMARVAVDLLIEEIRLHRADRPRAGVHQIMKYSRVKRASAAAIKSR